MGNFIDLTGRRFTRLVVIKRVKNGKHGGAQWFCLCDCGNYKTVLGGNLRSRHIKSCGCLRREQLQIHGMSRTPEYQALQHAKDRCYNSNNPGYKNYGGRGIKVCNRWRGLNGFKYFIRDIGPRPGPGYSLERIDNDGNYESGNCKWATAIEQHGNTRRNNWFKALSPIGRVYVSRNQNEFARNYNLGLSCVNSCLKGRCKQHKGWTFERTDK